MLQFNRFVKCVHETKTQFVNFLKLNFFELWDSDGSWNEVRSFGAGTGTQKWFQLGDVEKRFAPFDKSK